MKRVLPVLLLACAPNAAHAPAPVVLPPRLDPAVDFVRAVAGECLLGLDRAVLAPNGTVEVACIRVAVANVGTKPRVKRARPEQTDQQGYAWKETTIGSPAVGEPGTVSAPNSGGAGPSTVE